MGTWTDYLVTSVEDQQKFIVPLNSASEKLYYNQRMIIDAPVTSEPRAWVLSKINRISSLGLMNATLGQDIFDQHKDYIELDDDGNVIGMWADYYSTPIIPTDVQESTLSSAEITYSGLKPELKIGGSYKKFTVSFKDVNGNESDFETGSWMYKIGNEDASSLLAILTSAESSDVLENQIKLKFIGDDTYIGSVLNIIYISDTGVETSLDVSLISL